MKKYFIFGWDDNGAPREFEIGFMITGLGLRKFRLEDSNRLIRIWNKMATTYGDSDIVKKLEEYDHVGIFEFDGKNDTEHEMVLDEVRDLLYITFKPMSSSVRLVEEIEFNSDTDITPYAAKYDRYYNDVTSQRCCAMQSQEDSPRDVKAAIVYTVALVVAAAAVAMYLL